MPDSRSTFGLPSVSAIADVAPADLPGVVTHLAALLAAVAPRLAAVSGVPDARSPDRLLTVQEAAVRLRMSVDWVYRHAECLPFTRRQGRRTLRFLADRELDSTSQSI